MTMTMTLFEAKLPDEKKERRTKWLIIILVAVVLVGAGLAFWFRHWTEESAVDKFLSFIERKDYESAYSIWRADPQWKQHTGQYKIYPIGQFELDWGPSGEYGEIKSHKIEGSAVPRSRNTEASGVVVAVTINNRAEPACLWVETKTKAISFSPIACSK